MYQGKQKLQNMLIFVIDTISVLISYIMSMFLWLYLYKGMKNISKGDMQDDLGLLLFAFLATILFFNVNREFMKRTVITEFMHAVKMNALFSAVASVLLVVKGDTRSISRGVFFCTAIINIVLMCIGHSLLRSYLLRIYKKNRKNTQMLVITTKERAHKMFVEMHRRIEWANDIQGIIVIDENLKGQNICGAPVVSDFDNMMSYLKNGAVDEVFINVPYQTGKSLRDIIMDIENMGITVHLNIEVLENFEGFDKTVSMLGNIPVITFANTFFDFNKLIIKRMIDIIGSIVGLALTAVITVFLAPVLLIESKGPLFFKQKRVGKNGRVFYMYKFRSMYQDAEERKKDLMSKNEMNGLMFKMTDDPRITKVGKFIRNTSIDEMPQFLNVLKGDMSLVGTRPPTYDEFKKYEGYHKRRLSTKPGITGMWQVSGRNSIDDFEEVVKLDLEYIDNWCLALDIKIILKTIGIVFSRRGAK